ncbi:hypothetical protein HNP70_001105 [Borreliella kurtenbachii]
MFLTFNVYFGIVVDEAFGNADKTKAKKDNNAIFKDIDGLIFDFSPKKGSRIAILFKKRSI